MLNQQSIKKTIKLFLLCFILNGTLLFGQNREEVALSTLLSEIESDFEIRFSFAPTIIENKQIEKPELGLSLDGILAYISNKTFLEFKKIDDRYFIIFENDENIQCGKIIDSDSGISLAGIHLQSAAFSTVTNEAGFFYYPEQVTNKIIISHIGYETIEISSEELSKDCSIFMLTPKIDQLQEVLIQTLFTKGIDKQDDGAITINTKDFGLIPGQIENDVLQIIQVLPGVESVDETISNINIRGGTNSENLILWDDIKMYQSGHFFGLISAFNPDLTETVSLYKNGTPVRYGGSVSAVIDMHSKNDKIDTISGGAGFNLINASAFLRIPISKNFGLQFSGRKSLNSLIETPVYNTYSNRIFQNTDIRNNDSTTSRILTEENFSFYDTSLKALWDLTKNDKIRFSFLTIDNRLDFIETVENTSNSKTSELEQRSAVGGIAWNRDWSDVLSTYIQAHGTYYSLNAVNKDIFTNQNLLQDNEVLETGLKIESSIKFSANHELFTGYHFTETGISNTQDVNLPRFRDFKKEVLRTHSIFSNYSFKSSNKLSIFNLGARLNYFAKFDKIKIEPRINLVQKLGNGFALEAAAEVKSQATSQRIDFESDFLGVEKRRWILANEENIPILESLQGSFGFLFSKFNWLINIEAYLKMVDGISTQTQGFQNQFQFERTTGSYNIRGIELAINKKSTNFSSWLSYRYTNNNYEFNSLTPSIFPNNLEIEHSATVATSYTVSSFKISSGINWHSGKPYTEATKIVKNADGTSSLNFSKPNEQRLDDYFRFDISAEYLWRLNATIDAKINIAVLNITNKNNILNTRFAILEDENGDPQISRIEESSLGVTPNFSLQFLF